MKAAAPVEKDNKAHQVQRKKQFETVNTHVSEVEDPSKQSAHLDNAKETSVVTGSLLSDNHILAFPGAQTLYDKGSEIMHEKLQESYKETNDFNHPDTKNIEKGYVNTLSIDQIKDYHSNKQSNNLSTSSQIQSSSQNETSNSEIDSKSTEIENLSDSITMSESTNELFLPTEGDDATVERTAPLDAKNDPQFNEVMEVIKTTAVSKRAHTTKEKAEMQANSAAKVPAGERKSKARGQQVEKLDQQKVTPFKASDFKAKLKDRINNMQLPKNEKEVENFENHNNIAQVNQLAGGDVIASKKSVTGAIEAVAEQEPNEANVQQRTSTALPDPKIGTKVNIKAIAPANRPNSEVGEPIVRKYKSVENQLEKNNITDEMLANSNEPSFINALNAKKAAKENAENAPEEFKAAENKKLDSSKQDAQGKTNNTMDAMHNSRKDMLNGVTAKQQNAGEKNTNKHQDVVAKLNKMYDDTKKAVDRELNDLEPRVSNLFDVGAKYAKYEFEKHITKRTDEYKKKRYGSWYNVSNYGKRISDAWNGLPDEVNVFFTEGRQIFLNILDKTITAIANLVTTRLNNAKSAINKGRQEVTNYIKNLPADVKKEIKGDIDAIQGQFKELENSITEKESSLIESLATKYNNALQEVDELAEEMKKRNRGLLDVLKEATLGIWETIQNIQKTLADLLAGAIDIIISIVTHPIDFLSNLLDGVSQGFNNFADNILTHLKTGFITWLTGAMKDTAITIPEDVFSLKGIFSITIQVLGLGWDKIRSIGAEVIGEPVMKVLETGFEMVQAVRKDGVAGLWEYLKDQFTDLKQTVMDAIMDIIQNQVIKAAIKMVMSMFSPVGAFIKAAMMIIDTVKFFIQKAAQIMELVQAFIDGVKAIASGNVGAVAKSIENALAKSIPVLIGFLAALLGINGIADKVKAVIEKIRERVAEGIRKFWVFVKEKSKSMISKIGGKKDDKVKQTKNIEKIENENNDKVDSFKSINVEFDDEAGKETHHAYYRGEDLIIESNPTKIQNLFINKNDEARKNNNEELLKNLNLAKSQYYNVIVPKEKALKEANFEDSKNAKASISRQKKAKGFDDNRDLKIDLENELKHFSQKYLKKLFDINNDEYPLPRLPIMSDNVKARSFVADYLSDSVLNGTEANKHTGNLEGWSELTRERLKEPSKWVRMHLLPHQLGGDAVDSNLTPALGDINKKFSKGLELDAINLAKKAPKQDRKVIWYKFNIEYYNGNVYPKFLFASYGTYTKDGNDWKRNSSIKEFQMNPDYPDFEFEAFNMNDNKWDVKELVKTLGITEGFAKVLKQNGGYNNIRDLKSSKLSSKIDLSKSVNKENLAIIIRAADNNLITF